MSNWMHSQSVITFAKGKYTTGSPHKRKSHLLQAVINILQGQLTRGVGNTWRAGIYFHFINHQPSFHHSQWSKTLKERKEKKKLTGSYSAISKRPHIFSKTGTNNFVIQSTIKFWNVLLKDPRTMNMFKDL